MTKHYARVGNANPKELARLVQIIKGYMTAAELATKIGVNPSTISRILNEKITSPILMDTILKLARLITPEMGITEKELIAANGYEEITEKESLRDRTKQRVVMLGNAIMNSISRKGKDAWRYSSSRVIRYKDMFALGVDLSVDCAEIEEYKRPDNHTWGFCFLPAMDRIMFGKSIRESIKQGSMIDLNQSSLRFIQTVSRHSLLYYQFVDDKEMWDDELKELPVKLSYVVVTKEEYDFFTKKYEDLVLPMNTSLVYVDEEKGAVVAEFPFKRSTGRREIPFFDGQYFDDDDNPLTKDEYDEYLDEMIEEYIQNEKMFSKKEDQ